MACDECRELNSHTFRTADDLVHALRLAGEEMERGVLSREATEERRSVEQEAVDSALEGGALPKAILYRFRCQICGDRFTLAGDTTSGEGSWTREENGDT